MIEARKAKASEVHGKRRKTSLYKEKGTEERRQSECKTSVCVSIVNKGVYPKVKRNLLNDEK